MALEQELMIIHKVCPQIIKLFIDGNPLTSYIPKDTYFKYVVEIFGPSIKYLDNNLLNY